MVYLGSFRKLRWKIRGRGQKQITQEEQETLEKGLDPGTPLIFASNDSILTSRSDFYNSSINSRLEYPRQLV